MVTHCRPQTRKLSYNQLRLSRVLIRGKRNVTKPCVYFSATKNTFGKDEGGFRATKFLDKAQSDPKEIANLFFDSPHTVVGNCKNRSQDEINYLRTCNFTV